MPRASDVQKAERLNRARTLLRQVEQRSDAAERLARDCSISLRQAYRYLEQAQQLKAPVPPGESKLAFTVKLPRGLIQRVREYATKETFVHQRGGQPGVARAVAARARAWVSRRQLGREPAAWNIDLIVCCRTNLHRHTSCWCRTNGGQLSESEKGLLNPRNRLRR